MMTFFENFLNQSEQDIAMESHNISERRKYKRLEPYYDTIVYNGEIFGQLLDISQGGLSFVYSKNQNRINDMFFEVDILCCNKKLHITKILCKSVMDLIHPKNSDFNNGETRRRCVQFSAISPFQIAQLEHYFQRVPERFNNSAISSYSA